MTSPGERADLHGVVLAAAEGRLPLWARVQGPRRGHLDRVAAMMRAWADVLGLPEADRIRWSAAAFLHDAVRDAPPEELWSRVPPEARELPGPLLHGPAAAACLAEDGVRDPQLLLAVAWHTTGHPDLDPMGQALYVADALEPGRPGREEWRSALRARMPRELHAVLLDVAASRISWTLHRHLPIPQVTHRFWNRITAEQAPGGGAP